MEDVKGRRTGQGRERRREEGKERKRPLWGGQEEGGREGGREGVYEYYETKVMKAAAERHGANLWNCCCLLCEYLFVIHSLWVCCWSRETVNRSIMEKVMAHSDQYLGWAETSHTPHTENARS